MIDYHVACAYWKDFKFPEAHKSVTAFILNMSPKNRNQSLCLHFYCGNLNGYAFIYGQLSTMLQPGKETTKSLYYQ